MRKYDHTSIEVDTTPIEENLIITLRITHANPLCNFTFGDLSYRWMYRHMR